MYIKNFDEDFSKGVRDTFTYLSETGEIWREKPAPGIKGRYIAGHVKDDGYIDIIFRKTHVYAHRMAWFLFYGEWPDGLVDHINGNKSDNRIVNLRVCDDTFNKQNRRTSSRINKTGLLGVGSSGIKSKPYRAMISVMNKNIWLGAYEKPEDAHQAYLEAKRRLHAGCTI